MTPDEYTNQELFLDVGNGHQLYVQDWGNKDSKTPILFLHGGPGGSCDDGDKQRFDPDEQRIIFHDQRGCGKSLPYGSLEHNTTADLVEDIEKIAERLGLNKFILTGGSWGSCLALAYALKHPGRIEALVLRGIFTGSQAEIDYIDQGRFATHYPEVWDAFLDRTPAKYHDDPGAYHAKRALGSDEAAAKESAYAYAELESSAIRLDDRHSVQDYEDFNPTGIKLELHYLVNRCFMPDRYILKNAHTISAPVWLVQGRYDFVCPPVTAYELHQKLPDSHLVWTIAGHSGSDRETWTVARTILLQLTKD